MSLLFVLTCFEVGREKVLDVVRINAGSIILYRNRVAYFVGLLLLFPNDESDLSIHVCVL